MNILFARELWLQSASEIETSVYFVLQTYSDLAPNRRETVRDMESGMPGLQFGEVNIFCAGAKSPELWLNVHVLI